MMGSADGFSHEPGAMLRLAREEKGFDTAKLAAELHVPATLFDAMEENRFDVFDAPVYAKGFLRRYSVIVGLDPAVVIAAYDARSGGPAEPTHVPLTPAAPRIRLRLPMRQRLPSWRKVAVVLVVIAVFGAAYWYSGYRTDSRHSASASAVVPAKVETVQVASSGDAPNASGSLPQTIPLQQIPAADGASGAGLPRAGSSENAQEEITVLGIKNAWVEIRGQDGTRFFYDHVRAGEMRTVHGAGPWRIYLSDADAVEIRLGAHVVDVPTSLRSGAEARFGLKSNGAIQ